MRLLLVIALWVSVNALAEGLIPVEVAHRAFTTPFQAVAFFAQPSERPELHLCVERVSFWDEVKEIEVPATQIFKPGFLNLSSGESFSWGRARLPEGSRITELRLNVKQDMDTCGVNYSVRFDEFETKSALEIRLVLDRPVLVLKGQRGIEASLSQVIARLKRISTEADFLKISKIVDTAAAKK